MKIETNAAWRTVVLSTLIAIAAWLAHGPALSGGFVWDDDRHVTQPQLRSIDGLTQIWTKLGATQQYYPVLHSAFWLQHRAWGDWPFGYHVTNLALHALAAVLLAVTLRRAGIPGAWLAGLVFAVHPVHVESVAWISEQKNTLSAVFYLAAAWIYLRFDATRHPGSYALATICFILGLLTKTVIATLPAALLLVLWWRRGKLHWRSHVAPLAPWLAAGIGAGLFTAYLERNLIGAEGAAFDLSLAQRLILAGRAPWFYAGKLVWPENLTFIYPRWDLNPSALLAWSPWLASALIIALAWRIRTRTRGPLTAILFFGGSLFPVLGFFNIYPFIYTFVADHFQYLGSIGMIALFAGVIATLYVRARVAGRRIWLAAMILIVGALGFMSRQQARDYLNSEVLYRATLTRNPQCWMACNNLGKELMQEKAKLPEAIAWFERALQLRSDYYEAANNLGLALAQSSRSAESIPHLENAVRLKPSSFQAHNNLGIALAKSGRADEAVNSFARAAAINPTLPNIQENWAKALVLLGRPADAEAHFAEAARLRSTPPARNRP